jgi:branched-chain amino acid transport system permease protein
MSQSRSSPARWWLTGLLAAVLALLAALPGFAADYTIILLTSIYMYVNITVSWTIFSGPTRLISLASAAFFGVGIYTSAIWGKELPLLVVVVAGGAVSLLVALFIGLLTLRLRGMYFIIFTFGISELIKNFLLWWETNMAGTVGRWVVKVDYVTVYYVMLGILVLALLTAYVIRRSKFGLALQSIGYNEQAAAHAGINVTLMKAMAFAVSAFFMGAAGAIMATRWAYIDPRISFNPLFSFMPVMMAIFGGMGQLYGPVLGAAFFTYLEEYLITEFAYYYMLLFGIVLVAAILYLPNGVSGLVSKWWRRRAEVRNKGRPGG